MVGLVKLMGIVMVAAGAIFLVKPASMKKAINFWLKDDRLYLGGVLNLLLGIIFLSIAPQCAMPWFIILLGLLSLAKGLLVFILKRKQLVSILEGVAKRPTKALRIRAVTLLILGTLLIYSA